MLSLKNIANIDCLQFYRWITTLKYWQRYFDYLLHEHPLLNTTPSCPLVQDLYEIVQENLRKSVQSMRLNTVLNELTMNYINANFKSTCDNEIITALQ